MGESILADLKEFADALEAGVPLASKYTIRRVQIPDAPAQYSAKAVRATRDMIGVSQAVFSHLLGVSTVLVQAWEQGNRVPAPWARRLLDEVNHDPKRGKVWCAKHHKRRACCSRFFPSSYPTKIGFKCRSNVFRVTFSATVGSNFSNAEIYRSPICAATLKPTCRSWRKLAL